MGEEGLLLIPSDERRHLERGPRTSERPGGVGTIDLVATGPAAAKLLSRAREVLAIVLNHGADDWPLIAKWQSQLPKWFIHACSPELSRDEAEVELARWQRMSTEERAAALAETRWSLSDWLYWLEPDERQWFWWDARVESAERARVTVEVAGWPAPLGAIQWLLRAAGATQVEVEEPTPLTRWE
jgi:hypothetical protein